MASEQPDADDANSVAPAEATATEPRGRASREPDLQAHIGSKLKALYAEVVNQPVPDRLVELVRKLEERQGKGQG